MGFDLLPSGASLIFLTAVFTWFVISERRERRSRSIETTDGATEGQGQLVARDRINLLGPSMLILAGGILALAIGVVCRLESVW